MPSGPTYYDFFGVSASASAEQIRSAYLWLMKQHHPDLTGQTDKRRAADYAAILNRSYDVLKDPEKRALYDELLASEAYDRRKSASRRPLLTKKGGGKRAFRWDASSMGATALACMILLLISAAVWSPPTWAIRGNDAASAAVSYSPQAETGDAREAILRNEVRQAMGATAEEAQMASERCFAAARDAGSISRTEMCVVFDDAYVEWNQTSSNPNVRSAYFDPSIIQLRHSDAVAIAGSGESRLEQLRQVALKALLDEIRAEMKASAQPRPDGVADGHNHDFADDMSR